MTKARRSGPSLAVLAPVIIVIAVSPAAILAATIPRPRPIPPAPAPQAKHNVFRRFQI